MHHWFVHDMILHLHVRTCLIVWVMVQRCSKVPWAHPSLLIEAIYCSTKWGGCTQVVCLLLSNNTISPILPPRTISRKDSVSTSRWAVQVAPYASPNHWSPQWTWLCRSWIRPRLKRNFHMGWTGVLLADFCRIHHLNPDRWVGPSCCQGDLRYVLVRLRENVGNLGDGHEHCNYTLQDVAGYHLCILAPWASSWLLVFSANLTCIWKHFFVNHSWLDSSWASSSGPTGCQLYELRRGQFLSNISSQGFTGTASIFDHLRKIGRKNHCFSPVAFPDRIHGCGFGYRETPNPISTNKMRLKILRPSPSHSSAATAMNASAVRRPVAAVLDLSPVLPTWWTWFDVDMIWMDML